MILKNANVQITKLRLLREQRGITSAALAEITKINTGLLSDYELGKRIPSDRDFAALAEAFDEPNPDSLIWKYVVVVEPVAVEKRSREEARAQKRLAYLEKEISQLKESQLT